MGVGVSYYPGGALYRLHLLGDVLRARDFSQSGTGTYQLHLARVPAAFTVPVGDEGGALADGVDQDGAIVLGDFDLWSFAATPGDRLSLLITELTGGANFAPYFTHDGRRIIFASNYRNPRSRNFDLYLIDLTLPGGSSGAAGRAISSLSAEQLRSVVKKIEAAQAAFADKHDPYTTAHLAQVKERITKALDADYILNPSKPSSSFGGSFRFILGNDKSGQVVPDQVVPVEP